MGDWQEADRWMTEQEAQGEAEREAAHPPTAKEAIKATANAYGRMTALVRDLADGDLWVEARLSLILEALSRVPADGAHHLTPEQATAIKTAATLVDLAPLPPHITEEQKAAAYLFLSRLASGEGDPDA